MGRRELGARGSQLVSWPFKRYQGIRPNAINPTVFTSLPTLRACIIEPSSRLKMGFHKDFCFPRSPSLSSPHLLPLHKQQNEIQKENMKIKQGCRDLGRQTERGSHLGFCTVPLVQSLLKYIEKNRGINRIAASKSTALQRRVHLHRFQT